MKRLIAIVLFCVLVPCAYGETINYDNGDKYVGDVVNGVRHGYGTYTLTNGSKYVGEWKNGKLHGQGTFTWPSGAKYVGQYKDDNQHGQGTYTHPNGTKYVGEHKNGKRNGQGTYTYANGAKYVGQSKDGKKHGQGTSTWSDGRRYVGEFRNGKFHGHGRQVWGIGPWEGDEYVGEWKDGTFTGNGVYRYANGRTYVGGWKTHEKESGGFVRLPHGEGTFTWPSGSKYVGQHKDGRQHGQGTLIAADGHKYVGRWTNGRPHGDGTTTTVDGEKQVGEYRDGKLFDGVVYGASGEIKGTYSGGEYIPKDAPKPVSLTVSSYPSFAEIYIDSIYQGNTELSVELSPGTYSVNVKKNGYMEWQRTIQLNKDMDILASLAKKEKPKPKPEPSTRLVSTGTGFVINKSYIVTAEHVVDDCNNVTIRHSHKNYHTEVVARDASNDLGLLRLEKFIPSTAKLRGSKAIRLGEKVATYGYPLTGQLSDSAKITQGNINSLAGLKNDSSRFQYDAPTQFGNSGGPLLDTSGNVIGVVVSGLDDAKTQTINFAVKSYLVEGFLSSNNVSFEKAESTEKLELPDIAEKAERFTVLVGCWE